jgi:hypothetical protein
MRLSQTVIFEKKENLLAGPEPVGATATYVLRDDDDPVRAWRMFRRDHPRENSMEWGRKV